MIKSLIILVLLLLVLIGAFLSRPSQANFDQYIRSQQTAGLSLGGIVRGIATDQYLQHIVFHDRILWTSVESDGKTQYVGAFGHWFKQQ